MTHEAITMVEAVNLALAHELEHDENVVILGEDVGTNGGVFRATAGLKDRFGHRRVMDTPLAEAMIGGLTVGMASQGLKPVAEIQFMGFIFPALEHIICHAARLRNRTRGRLTCPMVLRAPLWRWYPCTGAPLREHRNSAGSHSWPAGGDSLLPCPCLRLAAVRHSQSRSGDLPGTEADLPRQ